MTRGIIGALVGAIILFVWQFMSWAMLELHSDSMKHAPNQDAILDCLTQHLPGEGEYFVPNLADGAGHEAEQQYMETRIGKPWAMIQYHESLQMSMGMNMIRGFVSDFIAIFLLCWLLLKIDRLDMKTALLGSLAVGLIGYLTIHYIDQIWFETNSMMDLLDSILPWGLIGLWLGYFLPRR